MRKLLKRATMLALLTGLSSGYALAQQAFVPGLVKAEVYSGFGGTAVADLTNNAAYPNNPSSVSFVKFLEFPAGTDDGRPPAGDVMSNYGVRISGFIIPTESGNYTFYISADDGANFFLSTDDTPANRRLLAWEPAWNPVRSFEVDVNTGPGRPGCGTGDCENISEPIALVANQRYYFEALMKEGGGGDNLAVTWSKDGAAIETFTYPNPDPLVGGDLTTQLPIKSLYLGTMADTTVAITRQPSDTAGAVGGTAQFSVGINATPGVTYQWKKNGVDIAGATSATYTTPALVAGDNNATYSVAVTKTGANTVTSSNATLRVVGTTEVSGVALMEVFNGMGGTAVPSGAALNALPAPNSFGTITALNSDPFFSGVADSVPARNDYLGKMSGYIVPTVSGNYDFFVSSDDASALYISPNATFPNPATDAPVAQETDCCEAFQEVGTLNDDGTTSTTTATPIALVANQKYAFIFVWKEGGGGDYGRVAWKLDTDGTAASALSAIPGANLRALVVGGVGITTHPQNVSVEENRSGTFTVGTLSTPGQTFQWQSAPAGSSTFTAIANATNQNLTLTSAARAISGTQYRVVVSNGTDSQTSNPGVLTVTDDVTPPVIASVGSFHNRTGLVVYFNEPVNATAGTYTLNNGATVQSSTVLGPTAVFLQTAAPLTAGSSYTVTVSNVRDLSANGGNLVTPNTATFTASAAAPTPMTTGLALYERWEGVTSIGMALTEVTNRPPDVTETRGGYEAPTNVADNYGGRLTAWFIPPSDGNYVFSVATDDNGRLFLSTDSNPANKKLIAQETGWAAVRAWSGIPDKVSSTFAGNQWPGRTISLKGGQPYYMETIWHEGGGGDNAAVTFWKEGQPMPANGTPPISGTNLVGNVAPDPASPPIILVGPSGRTFNKGDSITLSVDVTGPGPFTYQWIQNKRPIAGATSATYTIANADHTDIGDYSVLVSNANGAIESNYRGADDSARLIMASPNLFIIEAEDYNYEGGKHISAASDMSTYRGNAYAGLLPTLDVDYFNGPDQSTASADADAYGPRMPFSAAGYIETKGDADAINNGFNRNRGSFTLTHNYALGWGDTGDWQNYTRTFPAGRYAVFAGTAQDGDPGADLAARTVSMNSSLSKVTNPTIADNSAVGAEGGAQGLTRLGVFQSPFSGAWSSNDIIPLTDETTGNPVEIQLSGTETLRWTQASGIDSDFLLLYCLDCAGTVTPTISITRDATGTRITFTGTLVASETVDGDYTPVAGAVAGTPYVVSPTGTMRFFQARN